MMLKVQALSVRYQAFEAVRDISFDLQEGQWLMVAGPNGAGKSTLLKAIAGSLPFSGKVWLSGSDTAALSAGKMALRLAVLQQSHAVGYAFTVEELVRLGRYAHQSGFLRNDPQGKEKVDEALRRCGLDGIRRQNVLTLSGGELQRTFLAQVFAQDTPLLLLDEPASHLDLAFTQTLFSLISEWLKTPGRAVVSVVHDLQLARRYGTHALLMKGGNLAAGGTADTVFTDGNLTAVYGMDVPKWFNWLHAPWMNGQRPNDSIYSPQAEKDVSR